MVQLISLGSLFLTLVATTAWSAPTCPSGELTITLLSDPCSVDKLPEKTSLNECMAANPNTHFGALSAVKLTGGEFLDIEGQRFVYDRTGGDFGPAPQGRWCRKASSTSSVARCEKADTNLSPDPSVETPRLCVPVATPGKPADLNAPCNGFNARLEFGSPGGDPEDLVIIPAHHGNSSYSGNSDRLAIHPSGISTSPTWFDAQVLEVGPKNRPLNQSYRSVGADPTRTPPTLKIQPLDLGNSGAVAGSNGAIRRVADCSGLHDLPVSNKMADCRYMNSVSKLPAVARQEGTGNGSTNPVGLTAPHMVYFDTFTRDDQDKVTTTEAASLYPQAKGATCRKTYPEYFDNANQLPICPSTDQTIVCGPGFVQKPMACIGSSGVNGPHCPSATECLKRNNTASVRKIGTSASPANKFGPATFYAKAGAKTGICHVPGPSKISAVCGSLPGVNPADPKAEPCPSFDLCKDDPCGRSDFDPSQLQMNIESAGTDGRPSTEGN